MVKTPGSVLSGFFVVVIVVVFFVLVVVIIVVPFFLFIFVLFYHVFVQRLASAVNLSAAAILFLSLKSVKFQCFS